MSSMLPLTPEIVTQLCNQDLGRASTMLGWLTGINSLCSFFASPTLGILSDKFGRKPLLFFSAFGMAVEVGSTIAAIHTTYPFILLFAGKIVSGFLSGFFPITYAYVADVSSEEKKSQNFGLVGATLGIGFAMGPALSGFFSKKYSIDIPMYYSLGASVLNMLYALLILPESKPYIVIGSKSKNASLNRSDSRDYDESSSSTSSLSCAQMNPFRSFFLLNESRIALAVSAAYLVLFTAEQGLFDTYVLFWKYKFHWDGAWIGIGLSVAGVSLILSQGVLLRFLIPRIGDRKTILISLIVNILSLLPFGFVPFAWMMFPLLATQSAGMLATPTMQSFVSKQYSKEAQGEILGVLAGVKTLAGFIGPVIFNNLFSLTISDKFSVKIPGLIFAVAAAFSAVAWLICAIAFHKQQEVQYSALTIDTSDDDDEDEEDPEAGSHSSITVGSSSPMLTLDKSDKLI